MTIYAIIYLVLVGLNLLAGAYLHGKPKKDKYNFFTTVLAYSISLALLYFGGFFN